jgi:hypothetical protein
VPLARISKYHGAAVTMPVNVENQAAFAEAVYKAIRPS